MIINNKAVMIGSPVRLKGCKSFITYTVDNINGVFFRISALCLEDRTYESFNKSGIDYVRYDYGNITAHKDYIIPI